MIIASINDRSNNLNYYINLREANGIEKISISCVTDNEIFYLSKDEAKKLYNNIFISEMNFYEEKEGYKIYLDNANNKRYFQDGKEDLIKFYNNNGCFATMYSIKDRLKNIVDKSKFFLIECGYDYNITCATTLTFVLIAISLDINFINPIDKLDRIPIEYEESLEKQDLTPITFEEVESYIMNSNDEEMTDEKKKLLCNKDFIKDALSYIPLNKSYILRKKMNNLGLEYFSDEEKKEKDHCRGYVSSISNLNIIHLKNDEDNTFKEVAPHEFVHLFQDGNGYDYIREACADIMADEYFSACYYGYNDAVKRVRSLMEIIGPRPVIECNFKGTSTFVAKIKEFLSEEDSKELLRLFTLSPYHDENEKETNKSIDELLAKMYKNKFGKDINDDMTINYIYNSSSYNFRKRIYFNKHHSNYDSNFYIYNKDWRNNKDRIKLEEISINYVINNDLVEKCIYIDYIKCTKEEYYKARDKDIFEIKCSIKKGYHEGEYEILSDGNDKKYSYEEAMKKGIIYDVVITKRNKYKYDTLEECIKNHGEDKSFIIEYKDSSLGYYKNKKITKSQPQYYEIPSIAEKFPDTSSTYDQMINYANSENMINKYLEGMNKKTR